LSGRAACQIKLVSGPLGSPHFHLGESRGPAISFSRGGGKVWAALAGDESDIGIDVAGSAEFQGAYPFQRVFHPEELHHALQLTDGKLEGAAALLWTVKEAVVKALGCGFHLVEPRQISVYPATGGEGGYTFPVGLSGKALARFSLVPGRFLRVHSLLQGKMWLSIAVIKSLQVDHE
jgi:phosphopantetheinyl transferase